MSLSHHHYHLLIETTQPNLSRIMQYINTSYTTYYNLKHRRCGHLFQGRYKSILVDKDNYFLELTRYIHLSPVRAGITKDPKEYKWSSYHGYLRKGDDEYIDKEQISFYLNMSSKLYQNFILEGIGEKDELFKDVYAGFILGSPGFIKEKLKDLKVQVESKEFSYKRILYLTLLHRL